MIKSVVLALVAGAATLAAGAAHAGNVSWSIGISTPIVGTVFSNEPAYPVAYMPPARVYLPPPPQVVYAPAPPQVVYEPVPVYRPEPVYAPEPAYVPAYYPRQAVYYRPVPVEYSRYAPEWRHDHGRWDHHHHGNHWDGRSDGRRDERRDEHGWRRD